jgi:hypothetical protein
MRPDLIVNAAQEIRSLIRPAVGYVPQTRVSSNETVVVTGAGSLLFPSSTAASIRYPPAHVEFQIMSFICNSLAD